MQPVVERVPVASTTRSTPVRRSVRPVWTHVSSRPDATIAVRRRPGVIRAPFASSRS